MDENLVNVICELSRLGYFVCLYQDSLMDITTAQTDERKTTENFANIAHCIIPYEKVTGIKYRVIFYPVGGYYSVVRA